MNSKLCIVLALAAVCLAAEEGKTHEKRQVLGLATVPAVFNPVAPVAPIAPALIAPYVAPRLPYAALPYNVAAAYPGYNGNYLANNIYPYAGLPYNAVPYAGYPYGVGRVAAFPRVAPAFAAAPAVAAAPIATFQG